MAKEFWLSDVQWAAIEPLLPKNQPGARRVDDRRVISGIVHVLKVGCRWQDCSAVYGPPTTVYNRFHRWAMRGLWRRLFEALAHAEPGDGHAIDSTTRKRPHPFDEGAYRQRNLIERMFCRLKDWRRVATRYDKLAANFAAAVALAAVIIWWT